MKRFTTLLLCLVAGLLFAGRAAAFCFGTLTDPNAASVYETYDASTDRFFLGWTDNIMDSTCAPLLYHQAPPNTQTTGVSWNTAVHQLTGICSSANVGAPSLCQLWRPMCVFLSDTGAPPSLFLTINAAECEALQKPGSGWTYVITSLAPGPGYPQLSAFEVDPATGSCAAGSVPMYRFVNPGSANRGLVNHRYVDDEGIRAQMRARPGWYEEGIAFCVQSAKVDLLGWVFQDLHTMNTYAPQPPNYCHNGIGISAQMQWCMESVNMPPLSALNPLAVADSAPYYARTGALNRGLLESLPIMPGDPDHSFAQTFYDGAIPGPATGGGFFITSLDRSYGNTSSVATRTIIQAGYIMQRPFVNAYDVDLDLQLHYQLFVRRVRAAGAGNAAYVQPLVTFLDSSSGHRLVLSPGAIGTPPLSDFATRDAASGNALVFIALGTSSVGRNLGLPALQAPSVFDSDNPWGWGGDFFYRVNRTEFAKLIAMARTVDPVLGTDPATYGVESFGLKGEIVGQADIGYNVGRLEITLQRP
jgi:hypothetical protein